MSALELRQVLARTIKATATYYGRTLEPEVLSMMCDDLSDLDYGKCIDAYAAYRRNPKNRTFPLPAQIRELVAPEQFVSVETQAREISARIVGAIPKFGWCNARDAQAFIGPIGWDLVKRSGGWRFLCENVGHNMSATTLLAQLRDQLEGTLTYGKPAVEEAIGVGTREASGELESPKAVVQRLLNQGQTSEPNGPGEEGA